MTCGVYSIENIANGKVYIGSSMRVLERWKEHKRDLIAGRHQNVHLQRAWHKYGEQAFVFKMLLECAPESLLIQEQSWIDFVGKHRYNVCPYADAPMRGRKWSAARWGKALPPRTTEATRNKITASLRSRIYTQQEREKFGMQRRGKCHTSEFIEKMRLAAHGRLHMPHSESTKEKMRVAALGRKLSEEIKSKLSKAKLGRHWHVVNGRRVWSPTCQH